MLIQVVSFFNNVTGWCVLLLFYEEHAVYEGVDLCREMAHRYFDDKRREKDYFADTDELAWTASICQKDVFINTGILMIKMRCYEVR